MIQALQKRVYKRTKAFDDTVPEQLRVAEEAQDEASEIARKQGKVKDLTRAMAAKLNKENEVETKR